MQFKDTQKSGIPLFSTKMRMWEIQETYIDNNLQHILDRLHTYYDE